MLAASESSIVTEYRTIENRLVVQEMRFSIGFCTTAHIFLIHQ
jgi:hypothetical protein